MKKPWKERPVRKDRQTPHRKIFDERGVSPVIGTILMVAITVVLAATLYVMLAYWMDIGPQIPTGMMAFEETGLEDGSYTGRLIRISEEVNHGDLSITITDISTSHSVSMDPLSDGGVASCGEGELNITYQDVNSDGKLDASDVFYVENGEDGDNIVLTYTKGSDGQICEVKLS